MPEEQPTKKENPKIMISGGFIFPDFGSDGLAVLAYTEQGYMLFTGGTVQSFTPKPDTESKDDNG